jgi:riboflavin kinase / FMN adenylyltransferase
MKVVHALEGLRSIPRGAVMTVGNFDGVHLGHKRLLDYGRTLNSPLVVVTFEPHPLTALRPQMAPPRLTPHAMKNDLLAAAGVDVLVELAPEREVLSIAARAFFDLLVNELKVSHLVEGPDFNFGKGREGNITNLKAWAQGTSMQVHVLDELTMALANLHLVEVRSSLIRWLVAYGRMRDAAICLGRPYTLRGTIIRGFQRGRQLGMPTANFDCGEQFVPCDGVYAGRCRVDGTIYPAGVSIGTLPTFGETKRQVEAHLLGFDGDLYGQTMEVELLDYLREQIKFASLDALKERMWADLRRCEELVSMDPAKPLASVS